MRPISVIVPTYREAGSLPGLLDGLASIRADGHDLDVIIVVVVAIVFVVVRLLLLWSRALLMLP